MSNSKIVVQQALKTLFVDFDPEKGAGVLTDDYIQHNPNFPSGPQVFLGFLPHLKQAGLVADVHRMIADGDLVMTHCTYHNADAFGAKEMVAFDVFRVEHGKIAEHWDNLMEVPTTANASGHTLTDGASEVKDLDKTEENKKLVEGMITKCFFPGDFSTIADYISEETYVNHNPMAQDGIKAFVELVEGMEKVGKGVNMTKIHKLIGEGNFVLSMTEGTMMGEPSAFYDLFRVENGKVVEHWDVIQSIPAEFKHDNGKF